MRLPRHNTRIFEPQSFILLERSIRKSDLLSRHEQLQILTLIKSEQSHKLHYKSVQFFNLKVTDLSPPHTKHQPLTYLKFQTTPPLPTLNMSGRPGPFVTQIPSISALLQLAVTQPEGLLEYIRNLGAYRSHHREKVEGVNDVMKLLEEVVLRNALGG
jgi:hypothetical protein